MKFCQRHWDALRAAIDERGLTDLIPKDGETAAKRMASVASDGYTVVNFDPLMGAHNRLLEALAQIGGAGLLLQDGCPVCIANDAHEEHCTDGPGCTFSYDPWIDHAADEAKMTWDALVAGKNSGQRDRGH